MSLRGKVQERDFSTSLGIPARPAGFLKAWCEQALRSRLEPVQKAAGTLRNHEELLLNRFRAEG
jgi:hypothetical protein